VIFPVGVTALNSLPYVIQPTLWHCGVDNRKNIQPMKNLCHLPPEVLFWNKWRKKSEEEPADPGSPGKWPLKQRWRSS